MSEGGGGARTSRTPSRARASGKASGSDKNTTPRKAPAKKAKAQRARRTRQKDWAPKFLEEFAEHMLVSEACKAAGVGRSTVYDRRKADDEFRQAWDEIDAETTDLLEVEAFRRAAQGTLKPVFYKGAECGAIREYSDALLMFLLKARRPATYREHHRIEHTGADGGPVVLDVLAGADPAAVSPAARKRIAAELEKEKKRGGDD